MRTLKVQTWWILKKWWKEESREWSLDSRLWIVDDNCFKTQVPTLLIIKRKKEQAELEHDQSWKAWIKKLIFPFLEDGILCLKMPLKSIFREMGLGSAFLGLEGTNQKQRWKKQKTRLALLKSVRTFLLPLVRRLNKVYQPYQLCLSHRT